MTARAKLRLLLNSLQRRYTLLKEDADNLSLEPRELGGIIPDRLHGRPLVRLLPELKLQLELLDELRQALNKEVLAVKEHTLRVKQSMRENSALPVSRLPLEILAVIFDWVCLADQPENIFDVDVARYEQTRRQRFYLMATCKWWCKGVFVDSALWTQIVIYHSAELPKANHPKRLTQPSFRETLQVHLERENSRPLSLWVRWRSDREALWHRIWDYILPYLPQCLTIYLDLGLIHYPVIPTLKRLPLLQSLYYIQPLHEMRNEARLAGFPSLRNLWIEGVRGVLHWSERARLSLSSDVALNLTSLSIIGLTSGPNAILSCIALCRNLVALQWESAYTDYTGVNWAAGLLDPAHMDLFLSVPLSHPNLRFLWLGDDYAVQHLRWFQCPMLESVILRGCNFRGVKLNHDGENWDTRFPNLTRIYAHFHEYDSDTLVTSDFPLSHPAVKEIYLLTEELDVKLACWFTTQSDGILRDWPNLELLSLDADFLSDVDYVEAGVLLAAFTSEEKPFVLRVVAEPDDFTAEVLENIPLINQYHPQHLQFTPLGDPVRDWYQLWRDIVHDI